jgi:hypothetical protein
MEEEPRMLDEATVRLISGGMYDQGVFDSLKDSSCRITLTQLIAAAQVGPTLLNNEL